MRLLSLNDSRLARAPSGDLAPSQALDPKSLALARLVALVAVGGESQSYGAHADAAVDAGTSAAEIVDVLMGVIPVVGLSHAVAAAHKLALALGYDPDEAFGPRSRMWRAVSPTGRCPCALRGVVA
ncbi:carboxymuconolactone decarboxylase family protein [Jiangella muralis]|uniref:carboxymuconolactone decarboxylase family protein n=1 Tax=Jiangella muralis TaxID=702383 RepID=UPI0009F86648|nr:carboxymuconolactone decarboxylase family protein [Jiangella muralis]